MSDLTALVLTLAPRQPTTTPGYLGRAAYAWLLGAIHAADPALADELHGSDSPKPFTCSTVVGGRWQSRNSRLFLPAEPAWLRFTGLNQAVSAHLQRLVADPPTRIELDGLVFRLQSATLDSNEHPWAGQSSYQALAAPYLLAQKAPEYRLQLEFASPTTFRSSGRSQPVPMPGWVFGSLLDRWNRFSPVQVAAEARRYAEE